MFKCYCFLSRSEIHALYPNKFIQYDESRIYILNTLFNLPGLFFFLYFAQLFTIFETYSLAFLFMWCMPHCISLNHVLMCYWLILKLLIFYAEVGSMNIYWSFLLSLSIQDVEIVIYSLVLIIQNEEETLICYIC